MAKVFIEETTLTAIGDAIRGKTGKTELLDPANMGAEIEAIEAGGADIPQEALILSGNCGSMFQNGNWTWFLEQYGDQMSTFNLTSINGMFYNNTRLLEIPFTLNMKPTSDTALVQAFFSMNQLETCPKVRFNLSEMSERVSLNIGCVLQAATRLDNVDDFFDIEELRAVANSASLYTDSCLSSMYRLKTLPPWLRELSPNPDADYFPDSWQAPYWGFCDLYCLDEATDLPVWRNNNADYFWTSSAFEMTGYNLSHAKNFTFETNNGVPYVAPWTNQYLNLGPDTGIGYSRDWTANVLTEVYGANKRVVDDATYQALKNDPDWWTTDRAYSRYNHDSAVATINSLPNTQPYAIHGGNNVIQFCGDAGSATDGGAINTLTEAEIAVAAAKGWTVSIS